MVCSQRFLPLLSALLPPLAVRALQHALAAALISPGGPRIRGPPQSIAFHRDRHDSAVPAGGPESGTSAGRDSASARDPAPRYCWRSRVGPGCRTVPACGLVLATSRRSCGCAVASGLRPRTATRSALPCVAIADPAATVRTGRLYRELRHDRRRHHFIAFLHLSRRHASPHLRHGPFRQPASWRQQPDFSPSIVLRKRIGRTGRRGHRSRLA